MKKAVLESRNSDLLSEVSSGSRSAISKVGSELRDATQEAAKDFTRILYELPGSDDPSGEAQRRDREK